MQICLRERQTHNMQCVLICQRTGNWKSKEWEVGGEWKREWEFAQSCTGRDETISYTVLKLFTNIPRDDSALTVILFMTKEHNSGLRVSPTVWSCDTVNTEIRESEMVHMPTLTKD